MTPAPWDDEGRERDDEERVREQLYGSDTESESGDHELIEQDEDLIGPLEGEEDHAVDEVEDVEHPENDEPEPDEEAGDESTDEVAAAFPAATWAGKQSAGQADDDEPDEPDSDEEPLSEEYELVEAPSEELELPSTEFELVEAPSEEIELVEPPSEETELVEPPSEETELVEPPSEETELVEPSSEETVLEEAPPEEAVVGEPPSDETKIASPPPAPPGDTAPMPALAAAAAAAAAAPQALTPAEGGTPPGMIATPGPPDLEDDAHPPKQRLWPRFLLASVLIVALMAAATSVSALNWLHGVVDQIQTIPGLTSSDLPSAGNGNPQTLLIIGSDKRPGEGDNGRSDTTMLVRLDPDLGLISMFSLPRDLQVTIPGYGVDKLNAAYTAGGPALTLKTVKQLTGLQINHVINVDFTGFAHAVDAIGCVYVDVDHHYYHSNVGLSYADQYSEIDIPAGYQRLCGPDALSYVRYRHEDNDIVRAARQQDFLRDARSQVSPSKLWSDKNKYLDIFTRYASTDPGLKSESELINLLKVLVGLRNAKIQKVSFHGDIGSATDTFVKVTPQQLHTAIAKFLGQKQKAPPPIPPSTNGGGGSNGGGSGSGGGAPPAPTGGGPAMIDATSSADTFGSTFAKQVHFPIFAPTQVPPGTTYSDDSHTYGLDLGPDNGGYGAYRIVLSRTGPYGVAEYFGVQGTSWLDPPLLNSPSEVRSIDGTSYQLFYDGDRLRYVGWKTDEASYWVSNTLTSSLSEDEMLAIATSMKEFQPVK